MENNQDHKEYSFMAGLWRDIGLLWQSVTLKQKLSDTRKAIVINEMAESSTPGFDFYLLIILSCTIATLGLVTNSSAVIIGAMLIAPLMSPILGLSMSSLTGRQVLFRRSMLSILSGALLAIVLSALITFVAYRIPYGIPESLPNEILARIKPSPLDLGIALAGGAAAAYALAHPRLTATLPGVAISTALMPPLCTIGIGIAFTNRSIFLGSGLLFLTNLSAISFAGIITFALMGFSPVRHEKSTRKIPHSILLSALFVIIITIPLVILSWNTISSARFERKVKNVLTAQISSIYNAQLESIDIQDVDGTKKVTATVRAARSLTFVEVSSVQQMLAAVTQKPIALEMVVIPVSSLDTLYPPTPTAFIPTPTATTTPLPTATTAATPSPQPTSTPTPAFINAGHNDSISLYNEPDGEIIFNLPDTSPVWISEEQIINELTWVHITDVFGRSGWVLRDNLTF
ncbi:MAG: DUF389 domain-containing protein [Chloroflexi bacterium]|nr:DUF389 domain-containing protein [Chloroflexota bacterium]